jgi:glycosyltransferase involved in cell wall biosynthesis
MSSRPLLATVIINNYNYGRFLRAAIDSAIGQSYKPLEVIVVDDGSSDSSRDIIRSYGVQLVSIFKENGGQASALNVGYSHSHGDIVIFLDSDDVLLPRIVSQVVGVFDSQPDIVRVQYGMDIIDAQGMMTGTRLPPRHLQLPRGDLRRQVMTFPDDMTWMATSGNAFATRVIREIFPIPEQPFRILADFYLSHVTPLFGPLEFLDEIGAHYRVHGANSYVQSSETLNLEYIRQTINHWHEAHNYVKKFADALDLDGRPAKADDILSVAYIASRFISLKLDRQRHPIQDDRSLYLWWLGLLSARRRFDISWATRLLFWLWFTAMLLATKPLAKWLASKWLFPQSRGRIIHRLQELRWSS